MALARNINTREVNKFESVNGQTSVRVIEKTLQKNLFQSAKTTITTSATKINFPEEGTDFTIYHVTTGGTLWVGPDDSITAGGDTTAPMPPEFKLNVVVPAGNDNGYYGIVSTGSVVVYVVGALKE